MSLSDIYPGIVILIDAEFTCWEDSLDSDWSNPLHPAEMIESGMIAYDTTTRTHQTSFSSLVKPRVNPNLSAYCLNILPIQQSAIDKAPEFQQVMMKIKSWLSNHTNHDSPTAGWGKIDRKHTTNQSIQYDVQDPFYGRSHIQIDELIKTALKITTRIEREDIRTALKVKMIRDRHRALADCADLITFDIALSNTNL